MFHSIITDPPYGFRAGAKRSGRGDGLTSVITPEQRKEHVAMTQNYEPDHVRGEVVCSHVMATHGLCVTQLLRDLLDLAARTLVLYGRMVFVLPISNDFTQADLPVRLRVRLPPWLRG